MNFFSYESKPMQILMYVGDLIILNLLFLLCSLPIFTIGAAQAGLYSGVKVLQDPEDDTAPSAAFFKGFRTGFKQITLVFSVLFVIFIGLAVVAYLCFVYDQFIGNAPMWMSIVSLGIVALFISLTALFHARFNCTAWQLVRNAWLLALAHPLRSLAVGVLTWLPLVVFALADFVTFIGITPVWLTVYYSAAFLFSFSIMKKPFNTLIEHFNKTHSSTEPSAEAAEEAQV